MNSFGNSGGGMSSATSDPNTAHMRVFVGNLNTMNITKPTLQNIFGKYGNISAISIHRGFAFVQYNNAYAARSAVQGEHGSVIAGQTIDINISSEPKPNQKPATQQNSSAQSFGGYDGPLTGGHEAGHGSWNQAAKRGRGTRGGLRGAVGGRGRGLRGRGAMRGRGDLGGGPNKVQTGRVEKLHQTNKNKFNSSKKPMLPPMAARSTPAESPVIASIGAPIKGEITAATAPDGSQSIDLGSFKEQLIEVRDKINSLLALFPAQLALNNVNSEDTEPPPTEETSMEFDGAKKEA